MTTSIEAIRAALAAGPTPGKWEVCNAVHVYTPRGALAADGRRAAQSDGWQIADFATGVTTRCDGGYSALSLDEQMANARLAAACNPAAIAELLAELDAAIQRADAMQERCAQLAEAMRPTGGRAWTMEQSACYDALGACAAAIRELSKE